MRQKLLLGFGLLMFVTALSPWLVTLLWCWGYFGRDNLVFQYWWQCNCPRESEATRYAPYRVLMSACTRPVLLDISTDGNYILVANDRLYEDGKLARINVSDEIFDYFLVGSDYSVGQAWFITNTIILARIQNGYVFSYLDITTSPIIRSVDYKPKVLGGGSIDDSDWLILSQSSRVFIVDNRLVLGTNEKFDPILSIIIEINDDDSLDYVKNFLDTHQRSYKYINTSKNVVSPDGRLIATKDGVYLIGGLAPLIEIWQPASDDYRPKIFVPQVWSGDSHKVIYGEGRYFYIVDPDVFAPHWPVPQPILILDIPPQYWPASTPAP